MGEACGDTTTILSLQVAANSDWVTSHNGDPDSAGSSVRRASTRQTAGSRILSTGRLKHGTAKKFAHWTAQAGDGMHA